MSMKVKNRLLWKTNINFEFLKFSKKAIFSAKNAHSPLGCQFGPAHSPPPKDLMNCDTYGIFPKKNELWG